MTVRKNFPRCAGAADAVIARWRSAALVVLVSVLAVACGGSDEAADGSDSFREPPRLATIVVSATDVKVTIGSTQTVAAQGRDQYGVVMTGIAFSWASSNEAVATVADGVVTAVAAGSVSITASSAGVTSDPVALSAVAVVLGTVAIDKASLFFTGSGQSARLTAQVFDAQGLPAPGTVRWTSSAPGTVSVDANGQVMALAIGSATIVAESGAVRSPPTLAIVATPQAGALLVTDAQVVAVGPILRPVAGAAGGVGSEYEVTLAGVAAPAPGTVMLAAESAPVAGKVVATRPDPAGVVVTLVLAPLHRLFFAYDIRLDVDLSRFGMEAVPPRTAAAALAPVWGTGAGPKARTLATARPLDAFKPFQAWKCDASIKPQLVSEPIALSLENNLRLVIEDSPTHSKHALEGSAEIVGSAGLKLKAGFKASGRCDAQGQIKMPVFGWFSVLAMPAVRFGLGAEVEGEVTLVESELSIQGRVGIAPVLGWECGGASPACRGLNSLSPTDNLKTTSKIPRDDDLRAKVSAHFYVIAGLDAAILGGLGNVGLVEGRIGPKQSFDLGFEGDQATRPDYASSYELKLEGVIEPGPELAKAIEKVIDSDSTTVKLKAEFTKDVSESPKGTLTVSAVKARPGEPVDFNVLLAPASSLEYWQLGYNVTGLELWRRREGEIEFTKWKAMDQDASNHARYRWTPELADAGKYEVAAFVNTQIGVPWLEVAPNSVREVEVSCFAAAALGAPKKRPAGAKVAPQATTCADTWAGTSTYVAKTPGLPTANITAVATVEFVVDPSLSQGKTVYYKANGGSFTLAFNHPDACTTRLSPNTFAIVYDPMAPSRLALIDDGFNPPSYGFGGTQLVNTTATVSCPGRSDTVSELRGFLVNYAFGTGPYTPGQATLSGRIDDAATTSIWSFSRP
ncbi:MAG: Ig-like domain-containing protein [Caldimonas sp.]